MHLDFVQVVGHFFQGWRRGQRAMSKFGPIPQGGAIMRAMAAEGARPELQAAARASVAVIECRNVCCVPGAPGDAVRQRVHCPVNWGPAGAKP